MRVGNVIMTYSKTGKTLAPGVMRLYNGMRASKLVNKWSDLGKKVKSLTTPEKKP